MPRRSHPARILAAGLALAAGSGHATGLVQPEVVVADASLAPAQRAAMELAARRYGSFWDTGDEALALQALAPDFVDMTPPPGREQGPRGALLASRAFRAAVPDLRCEVEQMIVAGDRVVVHLHFRGHFTGSFQDIRGRGQAIDFVATDIYRIEDGRIAANWHIEDNLALMRQLGAL
ncbi:ester cyclase [Coralloluteibacterium stylophorae]|uniref:Ester cyclase n=1 Tax=Coralloluteibacterium stylophorae TaxID=1776034 RepID=A0A8J8AWI9_9GAMM|nr:ester cyclase [Coralloluteibacterium stylophorae]MBS7456958.1 ester cyclase [Coralloluteibacterium stylophorae]